MRIRLVTETDTVQDIGGTILAPDELPAALALEEILHHATGWHVDRYGEMIRATKAGQVRWIWPRTRSAMEDTL